jgi:hypothetical protein
MLYYVNFGVKACNMFVNLNYVCVMCSGYILSFSCPI